MSELNSYSADPVLSRKYSNQPRWLATMKNAQSLELAHFRDRLFSYEERRSYAALMAI